MKTFVLFIAMLLFVSCENQIIDDGLQEIEKSAVMQSFPDIIQLPTGLQPEGIATGPNHSFYVASLTMGQIYKGNLQTGEVEILTYPPGPDQTGGMAVDKRSGYLFAAKGMLGTGCVYNSKTGELLNTLVFTTPFTTLINDVVITNEAAYFTNSLAPVLYKVPLMKNGQLPEPAQVISLPLTGDFSMEPHPMIPQLGAFANGIDATPNGKYLFLGNTARGEIYRVHPASGEATVIDLGGALLPFADGILLDDQTLYVVQNMINQVAVIHLNDDLISGEVVGTITNTNFGVPTAVDEFGNYLYAVNAHFDVAPPTGMYPGVEFEVVKFPKFEEGE
ncbi:hypothetical protein OU798_01290 [Prolixibacteraceae bacterium Z1-6]|uniref:Superoxide dismutase n=1 Tax=Draconibacterium aestuarii TaxID=2998507 RepID=A0A9X3F9W0_9BACT|nr:hypothetical protein [Prolixibacteraceae bacterium Z1-6]